MGKRILSVGGNTFQFFTKNPKGGKVNKPADTEDVAALRKLIAPRTRTVHIQSMLGRRGRETVFAGLYER